MFTEDSEENNTTLTVVHRNRDPKKFIECESTFSAFQLQSEFTNDYELFMQGSAADIKKSLDKLSMRLEQYTNRFPNRMTESPFRFPKDSEKTQKSGMKTS